MRMKWFATGLLILAAIGYFISEKYRLHYLSPFTEAAMGRAPARLVGGAARPRRPHTLPIRHTAIIPRNKDRIARGLSEFIQHNFLSAGALVQRIAEFRPAHTPCRRLPAPAAA